MQITTQIFRLSHFHGFQARRWRTGRRTACATLAWSWTPAKSDRYAKLIKFNKKKNIKFQSDCHILMKFQSSYQILIKFQSNYQILINFQLKYQISIKIQANSGEKKNLHIEFILKNWMRVVECSRGSTRLPPAAVLVIVHLLICRTVAGFAAVGVGDHVAVLERGQPARSGRQLPRGRSAGFIV